MKKRFAAVLCAFALIATLIPQAVLAEVTANGLYVSVKAADGFSWANIILGEDETVWPFAANTGSGDAVPLAFSPEPGVAYRLTFDVTSTGTEGIRVRWCTLNDNGSYTSADADIVNDHLVGASETATVIPAYFQNTLSNGVRNTFTVEFTLTGNEEPDGLSGNIAIRGQGGNDDFILNWVKVEEVGGATLIDWQSAVPLAPVEIIPEDPEPAPEPEIVVEPESVPDAAPEPEIITEPIPEPSQAPAEGGNPTTGEGAEVIFALSAFVLFAAVLGLLRKRAAEKA